MNIRGFVERFFQRVMSGGYTHEEMAIVAGGGKDSDTTTQRILQPEEKALLKTQADNLSTLTKIAQETYNLSNEERSYYDEVFRTGTDTEAKDAIAKLKEKITGEKVDPASIKDVSIDSLLRDSLLTAAPEFQTAAANFIDANSKLSEKYGTDVTGVSKSFADATRSYTSTYAKELEDLKAKSGTIDQDVLSRETGAALGGISTAYAEARKQMAADLARRGLAGTGVESQVMQNLYGAEAMAKGAAGVQARTQAFQQTQDMVRAQAGLAGQGLQGTLAGEEAAYQAELGGIQNVYGVTQAQQAQDYQAGVGATLQGLSTLQQVAAGGQGVYLGSQNYMGQSISAAGTAAQTAGSTAANLNMYSQSHTNEPIDIGGIAQGIGGLMTGYGAL